MPTLDGKVGVRVPKGTADGRILRVRGRGVPKRSGGNGDLLVTVKVAVPPNLEGAAQEALEAYATAEQASGFDPRAGWAGNAMRGTQRRTNARTFLISVAAELAGMHAQTLRTYDRLGLVSPRRTSGGGRRYSQHDVDLLREVQRLSQDEGVNLAGIKRIIELTNQVEALQARMRELAEELDALRANQRRDVAVVPKSTALVVWQPRKQPLGTRGSRTDATVRLARGVRTR